MTFCIFFAGLVGQLLGIVVRKERPELEEQKDNLVQSIAANKKKLEECEDEILRYMFSVLLYMVIGSKRENRSDWGVFKPNQENLNKLVRSFHGVGVDMLDCNIVVNKLRGIFDKNN